MSVLDLVHEILRLMHVDTWCRRCLDDVSSRNRVRSISLSAAKARQLLGWRPTVQPGSRRSRMTIDWYQTFPGAGIMDDAYGLSADLVARARLTPILALGRCRWPTGC